MWTQVVDPASPFVDPSAPAPAGSRLSLHVSGDPSKKLDLLVLGDGYTAAERGKFEEQARRLTGILLDKEPFKGRAADLNVWGLCPAAADSGSPVPPRGSIAALLWEPRTTRSAQALRAHLRQSSDA